MTTAIKVIALAALVVTVVAAQSRAAVELQYVPAGDQVIVEAPTPLSENDLRRDSAPQMYP